MPYNKKYAKINIKVLIIFIIIVVALITSLFTARQVRRRILSKILLQAGEAAFEKQDWPVAYTNFREYLGRNPNDVDILKQYAKAAISIRPLNADAIKGAVAAYRRVIQFDPLDKIAYDKLAMLYEGIGNFEELAYIARTRIERVPDDPKARYWLAKALFRLGKRDTAEQELDKHIKQLDTITHKGDEYIQACALMSEIKLADTTISTDMAESKALEYLKKAVDNVPESIQAEALVIRARFYRKKSEIASLSEQAIQDNLKLAEQDLLDADALGPDNPQVLLSLGVEWMEHGELDRSEAELRATENLTKEKLEEHFLDINTWIVKKFIFSSDLAIRRKATTEDASLADNVLAKLEEKSYRFRILPSAIMLYIATNNIPKARLYLNEYLGAVHTQDTTAVSKLQLAYLQALVATAEEKPYIVINVLQPAVVADPDRPELWQLLSEAFIRTDQNRRAISALINYIRLQPRDPKIKVQLAKEYLKLQDWNKAFETAQLADSQDPTDIIIRLLRIETSIYVATEQTNTISISRLEELSTELAELRKENPDRVHIRILQAIIAEKIGELDKAEAELKSAIEECDEPLLAKIQLARYYSRTKHMDEALSVCQDACKSDPNVADPWLSLSGIYVKNKDYDSARKCLREGLNVVVGKWEKRSLSIRLAQLEFLYGDRSNTIRILSEIAAQDDQEIRARTLLLSIREVREDKRKVEENMTRAEKLVEELNNAEGETGLYWRLYQASLWLSSDEWRSKQQDIIDNLQYCINLDPEWSSPVLLLAQMYEKLEDFTHVEETCQKALARNPSATDVTDFLVTIYEKQGRYSDAEKVIRQIETNTRVLRKWASARQVGIALNAGNYSHAIDELKFRVSNNDQDANSRILLARLVYWQNPQDVKLALDYLKEAEAIAPDSMALITAKVSILRAESQDEKAQQILDDYVANQNDFRAYIMRAAYLSAKGQFELAEKDYKKLITFPNQEISGYVSLSNFYARNNKQDQAILTLEEGLNEYPDNLRLKRRLMKMLFLPGPTQDKQKALNILTMLQERLPQDPELMKLEVIQILQTPTPRNLQTARQKLEQVVKLEPTAVDAHLLLINIAIQEERYEDVRDLAVRALGANPDNAAFLSARALAEFKLENIQMAVQLVQLALQKDPNNIQARDVLVETALKSKAPALLEQARTLTESALKSDPTNEQLLLSLANLLISMDNPQAAIPELETYCQTEKGSNSTPGLMTLAELYRLSGDMVRSQQKIQQAEQLNPKSLSVIHGQFLRLVSQNRFNELSQISSSYLSAKEQDPKTFVAAAKILASLDSIELKQEALKLFRHAANLAPTLLDARLGLAYTLYQTGDTQQAKRTYQELLDEYPTLLSARLGLAYILYQTGDIQLAKQAYLQILNEHPNNIKALNDLAWILQEQDQSYDAALELANRGLILSPDEMHLLDTRGTILENKKQLEDARKDFARLVQLTPPDSRQKANALLKLGRICAKLTDLKQAKQHLKEALEIDGKINVFTPDERSEIRSILQESRIQAINR